MPADPLRFVHAANVYLDRPLRWPYAIPAAVRETIEDATLISFENLVNYCCESDVDFLLLTGNTFVESEKSLAARVVLLRELQKLDEAGISTFVLPGDDDPPEAWHAIPDLPSSVTIFHPNDTDPVAIEDHGQTLATIESATDCSPNTERSNAPFTIGLRMGTREWLKWKPKSLSPGDAALPSSHINHNDSTSHGTEDCPEDTDGYDYLALGGNSGRTTLRTDTGLIHHPGLLQGNTLDDAAHGSATLVDWDGAMSLKTHAIPTAAVRFIRMSTGITRLATTAQLQQTVLTQLAQSPPADGERVRLITWQLTGAGPLLPVLLNDHALKEFHRSLHAQFAATNEWSPVIHFDLSALQEISAESNEPQVAHGTQRESTLAAEFRRALQLQSVALAPDGNSRWDALAGLSPSEHRGLKAFIDQIDVRKVMRRAEHLGTERLVGMPSKGTQG